jgi:RES domain
MDTYTALHFRCCAAQSHKPHHKSDPNLSELTFVSMSHNQGDLRPKHADWPFLTGDTTYPPCQALAREAKEAGATAILSPSARRTGGTTSPVFVRQILSAATILGVVIIEIEASGETRIIRPPSYLDFEHVLV